MKKTKRILSGILAFTLAFALTACGTSSSGKEDVTSKEEGVQEETGTDENTDTIKTVKVGTMGTYNPYSFEDESGTLTGYDLEVLRLLEEKDSSLKFEFIAAPWDSLFVGLDSDKFQVLANQITSNPDRVSNYSLTQNQYFTCVSQIIVKKGTKGIEKLEDLKGKKIGLTVGDSFTRLVEDWNVENDNILTITYYEQGIETILQDIESGRIDATVNDPAVAQDKAKIQGLKVEAVGERLSADPTYFIFRQDEEGKALKEKVDGALKKAIDDGSLSELSIEWFGNDYTK